MGPMGPPKKSPSNQDGPSDMPSVRSVRPAASGPAEVQEQRGAASGEEPSDQSGNGTANGKARVGDVGDWSEVSASRKDLATHRGNVLRDMLRIGGSVPAAAAHALGLIEDKEAVLRQKQVQDREAVLRAKQAALRARQAASSPAERACSTDEAPQGRSHASKSPERQDVDMQDVDMQDARYNQCGRRQEHCKQQTQ